MCVIVHFQIRSALFLVLMLAAGSAYAAVPIQGVSRGDITKWFAALSMTVEDKSEKDDDPWLVVTTKDDRMFNVFLHQCASKSPGLSVPCTQVRFKLFWDNDKGITLDAVNKFNLDYVFGRGFITGDKKLGVDYAMNLKGGATRKLVEENVQYFLRVVDDFETEIKP